MRTTIPSSGKAMSVLLRADFTTQWRNRRSVILMLLVPVMILVSWKGVVAKLGGPFVLASCITIGLTAVGLMGYSNSIARDRDKGVFQRLRVAPVHTWCIMISRIFVQLVMILLITILVFVVGANVDKVYLSAPGYMLGFLMALIGASVYLGLGQMIAGLLKNAETVNSATRLVYFLFIMLGMFGQLGILGEQFKKAVVWSPYGTVQTILAAGMQPSKWTNDTTLVLAVTIFYAIIFSALGIKKFRWNTQ